MSTTPTDILVNAIADAVVARLREQGFTGGPAKDASTKLVSLKDGAVLLSRSVSTTRQMVARGDVPSRVIRKFGNRTFFLRDELDKWLTAR